MDIAESIKFRDICTIFDKVKNAKDIATKEKYLRRYYESFSKHRGSYRKLNGIENAAEEETGGSSFYCILRSLIPGSDNGRKVYGMQITTLAKVYIKVLQLAADSREAERLHARSYSAIHGDYADIVYSILLPRTKKEDSNLTLKEIHEMLDSIADDDRRNTEKVLTRLSEIASAREQKWFIRLLLKSMHLGIGEQRIFAVLHPLAKQIFQRCSNLQRVCCMLADNKFGNGSEDAKIDFNAVIKPFQHIRPMLCEIFPGNIEPIMASDVLYMETKMDGERFQLHYEDECFKYISRNGVDYTANFGNSYESGNLTPEFVNLLPIGMQSIILDGEMMVWDELLGKFRDKGENTDVKHLSVQNNQRPCFVLYDLLYYNGQSLLDMPYAQRTHKLKQLIKEKPGVLQIMQPKKVTSVDEFKRLFQQALNANEEGVVLKKQESVYRPGVRYGGGWYKVKADYIEGLTTEFDLLIIGGFYNRARTFIESFLLGILKSDGAQKYEVYSVGKVSNITRQRVVLNNQLKPHWQALSSQPPPLWYHYCAGSAEGRPDVWIEPRNSTILQIKAADLAPSAAFVMSKCLHFPRTVQWRNDKSWDECMTLYDYMQLVQGKRGIKKINKRELSLIDFTTDRKIHKITPAAKRKFAIQSYEQRFDAKNVQQVSNFLAGFSFCILSVYLCKNQTPEMLKALVVENGGEIVENPIPNDPKCISIAGDITFRVETIQKSRRYNILQAKWLLKICKRRQIKLRPQDMICMTDELADQFSVSYDKYGDSYTEHVTVDELEDILDDITAEQLAAVEVMESDLRQLAEELGIN